MDTRQTAQIIFDNLTDKQLKGFIMLFGYADKTSDNDNRTRAQKAFEHLNSIIRPIPDLDEDKEKDEYFREKYGL